MAEKDILPVEGATIGLNDGSRVRIVDPNRVAHQYVDIVCELRIDNGCVQLSTGKLIVDSGDGSGKEGRAGQVVVASRLSVPLAVFDRISESVQAARKQRAPTPGQKLN